MGSERFGFQEDLGLCDRMGLRPFSIGWQESAFPLGVPQRRILPLYELVFVERGRHYHQSAASPLGDARSGTVILNFPGIWHRYGPPDATPAKSWWFLFDGALAGRWREQGLLNPARPILPLPDPGRYARQVAELWRQLAVSGPDRSLTAARGIVDLLHELVLQTGRQNRDGRDEAVRRVLQAMAEGCGAFDFDLPIWCAREGIEYEDLRKRFKEQTGLPPGAYFSQLKLARVKEQLAHGRESVLAIARGEGFEDPYYFSRWFKRWERISPSAYAKLMRDPSPAD
ncbi:MAG: helix-turn-helix transcriptional regulator [Spirochaetes bacterium]|nr:helix-turn-helix transcriptional regulator [Spirochaetota bacterium]